MWSEPVTNGRRNDIGSSRKVEMPNENHELQDSPVLRTVPDNLFTWQLSVATQTTVHTRGVVVAGSDKLQLSNKIRILYFARNNKVVMRRIFSMWWDIMMRQRDVPWCSGLHNDILKLARIKYPMSTRKISRNFWSQGHRVQNNARIQNTLSQTYLEIANRGINLYPANVENRVSS
jgi:hypothetical protein